jgi:hypothetical protein
MGFQGVGRILICVHTAQNPSDSEWSGYVTFVREQLGRTRGAFVYTAGGAPNSKQRKALFDALGQQSISIAVVSPSRVALAIGVAISWFQPNLKTFSPAQLNQAIAHLKLEPFEADGVLNAARRLTQELGMTQGAMELSAGDQRRTG